MSKRLAAITFLTTLAACVFAVSNFRSAIRVPPPACEVRSFDHIALQRLVSDSENSTRAAMEQALAATRTPDIELRVSFFEAKLSYLAALMPVVRSQLELSGATHSCVSREYHFLFYDLSVPQFRDTGPSTTDEILKRVIALSQPGFFEIFKVVFPVIVPSLVVLLGYWLTHRKKAQPPTQSP